MAYYVTPTYYPRPRIKGRGSRKTNHTKGIKSITSFQVSEYNLIWGSIYANKEQKGLNNFKERLAYDIALVNYLFDLKSTSIDLNINPDILRVEQTQKASLMNRVGVILANITAKETFKVKHLHHLQNFRKMKIAKKSKLSPDFVAKNKSGYYVIESKATVKKSDSNQERHAIKQLNAVKSINGNVPQKYLIQTTLNGTKIEVQVVDPDGNGEDIELEEEGFEYYRAYYDILEDSIYIGDDYYKSIRIGNYVIGITDENLENDKIISNKRASFDGINYNHIADGIIFTDGTLVMKISSIIEK